MIGLILFLVVFFVIILPLIILISILWEYALRSFALYRIAKQTDACKPAYAWIPVVQYWVMGKCAEACDAQTGKGGKKNWKWGKIMLILRISYLGAMVFLMPIAFVLALFGGGIFLEAISWLAITLTVFTAACTYKIYRYYVEDPYDILALVLTVLYPGWISAALLIASFLKPCAGEHIVAEQTMPQSDGAAVIPAEQEQEGGEQEYE